MRIKCNYSIYRSTTDQSKRRRRSWSWEKNSLL